MYIGNEHLARLAKALIRKWRAETISPRQRERNHWLFLYDLTARCRGYSARARRRLRVAAVRAFDDPRAQLRLAVGLGQNDPEIIRRRPGRPRRAGLC